MRLVMAAIALASVACSLFVETQATQCKTDLDCTNRGGDFAGSICGADGICTKPSDGGKCTTNKECIDRVNAPAICKHPEDLCAPLGSPDCTKILGDPSSDDAVIVGVLSALTGPSEASGLARTRSIEVAYNDIKQNVPGIPTAADGKPRSVVVVECDSQANLTRAATHLVQEVHAPAIIGPESSGDVITVSSMTIPAGVLLVSPSATSTAITNLQDDGLVWRTAPSDALQSVALLDQLPTLESKYRTDNAIANTTKIKVAFVYSNDAYGLGLYNSVSVSATINGKPLADPSNSGQFLAIQYEPKPTDMTAQVNQILSASPRPAIIVGLGNVEIVTLLMAPLEQRWGTTVAAPEYLLPDAAHKPDLVTAAANDALRKRVRGTIPSSPPTPAYNGFILKYEGAFGSPAPQVFGMAGAYDATFLLTYGIAATPGQPITGGSIASGLSRLVAGQKLDVGGANLSAGFQILSAPGATFDFEGASGPLDFDLTTGEAPSDIDVWCIGKDGTNAPVFVSTGRFYDATVDKMSGTVSTTACQ